MEIRNNRVGGSGADGIDLTRANRDAIRDRAPNPPAPPKAAQAEQAASTSGKRLPRAREEVAKAESVHKRIANARDRFESVKTRVANARDRFESDHERVQDARVRFESVHKRIQGARARNGLDTPDQVTLSSNAQELADTAITPSLKDVDVAMRTKHVHELKAQYGSGQLDVESLVAESAYRMLSGE